MADIVNPYSNPYLPSFISQRPRMPVTVPQTTAQVMPTYSQIHSVNGFDGARSYNLSAGSSEILAEADPQIPRIYVVACDANGQKFVEGYRLIKEEEPKPVTMEDLSSKMNELLERITKLEGKECSGQSNNSTPGKNAGKPNNAADISNDRNFASSSKSWNGDAANGGK